MAQGVDVCVIGGGVIGLATAWELHRRGLRVEIFDTPVGRLQASWAGGGILSDLPPGSADARLQPLLADSLERYPAWCEALREASGIDPQYWRCGAHIRQGDLELPSVAQVNNPRLLKSLRQALTLQGVAIHPHTVNEILIRAGRVVGVQATGQSLACDRVVVAAGAWSARLIPQLPVTPIKGEMLLYRARPGLLDHIRLDDDFYLVPRRDGRILAGSTVEPSGFEPLPTVSARVLLHRKACALLPELARVSIEDHWVGLRPGSPQGLPSIGAAPQAAGLFLNTGHYRLGITLAPGSACLLADRMLPLVRDPVPSVGPDVSQAIGVAKYQS